MYATPDVQARHITALHYAAVALATDGFTILDKLCTGSAVYGKPNPADYDVAVLLGGSATPGDVLHWAMENDWDHCGRAYSHNVERIILRKKDVNLFVFLHSRYWDQFVGATLAVRRGIELGHLSLQDKDGYTKVFKHMRGE